MPKRLYKFKKEEIKTQKTGTYFNAKNSNKKSYEAYTKEDLIAEIEQLKKRKQYGLVWEEQEEKFDKDTIGKLPVLKEIKNREIQTDKKAPVNLLIEGDNYHSLSVLNYTHEKAVDVIYIDPPYNTGNREFIFNDKIIDLEDSYRHSKWLSFMEKRLKLAKNLLKNTGIIFISIDDNEFAQLKLLMDEIFGENNFEPFIWKKKGGAGNTEKIIGKLTEYIVCYFKNKKPGIFNYRQIDRVYKYKDKFGPYNLEGFEKTNLGGYERKTMLFPIVDPKTGKKFYPAKDMRWTMGQTKAKELIKKGKLYFDYKKNKVYIIKRPADYEKSKNVFYNLLSEVGSLATAKDELYNFFGNREIFDTPKPTTLIKHLLEISSRKDSIILDFMAGSGTTAQAVLQLNKEDGGYRQFILCTNNENNICTDICYPRAKKVIEGYKTPEGKKVSGLSGNLKYYKTAFVGATPSDANKKKLTDQSTEMLCIRENTFEKVLERKHFKIFKNNQKHTGILYDQVAIPDFKKVVKNIKGPIHTYIFSLEDEDFSSEFEDMNGRIVVSPIPEVILRVYRRIFGIKI